VILDADSTDVFLLSDRSIQGCGCRFCIKEHYFNGLRLKKALN